MSSQTKSSVTHEWFETAHEPDIFHRPSHIPLIAIANILFVTFCYSSDSLVHLRRGSWNFGGRKTGDMAATVSATMRHCISMRTPRACLLGNQMYKSFHKKLWMRKSDRWAVSCSAATADPEQSKEIPQKFTVTTPLYYVNACTFQLCVHMRY